MGGTHAACLKDPPWAQYLIGKTDATALFLAFLDACIINSGALDRLRTPSRPSGHRIVGFRATLEPKLIKHSSVLLFC